MPWIFKFASKLVYSTDLFVFPEQSAARATVPGGPSIACSTAKAVEWDATWSKNLDPSGRAALGVHVAAYEEDKAAAAAKVGSDSVDSLPKNGI